MRFHLIFEEAEKVKNYDCSYVVVLSDCNLGWLINDPRKETDGEKIFLTRMGNLEAVKQLIRNSFSLDISDRRDQAGKFKLLASLIQSNIEFFSLIFQRKYQDLLNVVEKIITYI